MTSDKSTDSLRLTHFDNQAQEKANRTKARAKTMTKTILTAISALTLLTCCDRVEEPSASQTHPFPDPPTITEPPEKPGEVALPGNPNIPTVKEPPEIVVYGTPPEGVTIPYASGEPSYGSRTAAGSARESCPKTANKH